MKILYRIVPFVLLVGLARSFSVNRSWQASKVGLSRSRSFKKESLLVVFSEPGNNQEDKIKALGFTDKELERSNKKDETPINVKVVETEVDPVTLTAIGFGLIACNFFIFANMGDGGLAGLVAKIINLSKQ